jgi:polysaccharide export outer membrane protein
MVKNRLILRRMSLMFLCTSLVSGALTLAGNAQLPGVQSTQAPTGAGSSTNKSASVGQGLGPVVLPRDFSEIRIEPGDLLSVNVYDTPELSDGYRVDPTGNLTLPLCGKVKVQGLTATEAARLLETTLRDGQVLVRPQVNVDVQQYAGQYVTVLGEVGSPGRVTVIGPTKLSEVLAQVGGLTPVAGTRIKIRHGVDDAAPETEAPYSRSESNQQTGSILLRPGDTVLVPRAGIVYVLGAVFRPGGYLMQEDGKLNVAEALALSGGTVLQAKTNGLRVIRRNPDGTVLDFALSYDGIAKGSQTPLELQAQDVVYVPMNKLKATLSDATSILSAATSAAIVRP